MKTKFTFYLAIMLLFGISAQAFQAPASLALQGSATETPSTPIPMKLIGNVYELYTSLNAGSYSFAGDNSIVAANTTVTEATPYRIRVDYSGSTPVVEVKKVLQVLLWAPWNKYIIANLSYAGNSSFKATNITYSSTAWGDERYRIKVTLEGGTPIASSNNGIGGTYDVGELTYARGPATNDQAPTGSTSPSYYDLYANPNGQWVGTEFKLATLYSTGSPFNAEVIFGAAANYTHKLTDYVPQVAIANNLTFAGSALENGPATLKKSATGIFEFVGGLQNGSFTISGTDNASNTYNYTSSDNSTIIQGSTALTVAGVTGTKPYYIRVNLINNTIMMQEISAVNMYFSGYGNASANNLLLTYNGNGKFQGTTASLVWPAQFGGDSRYKFKMDLANSTSVFWGSLNVNNANPPADGVTTGVAYDLYSVTNNDYDNAFKFRAETQNQQVTVGLDFNASGTYSHKYLIGATLPLTLVDFKATEENVKIKLVWKTENEVNFKEFEVEKSTDGLRFESLGTVSSNNLTGPQQYSLNDHNIAASSTIYYRLKMIDNDGTLQFSKVIVLKTSGLQKDAFAVYYTDDAYLQVVHPIAENNAEIKIFGIDGALLNTVKVQRGNATSKINVSALNNGVFVLGFQDDSQAYRAKFVK